MQLRPYQQAAVEAVYRHLRERDDNPVVVIPTAGGKTPVIATICKDAVTRWSGRVLVLARELPARGGWYCATRSHAKVIAARFTDGRCFVIESSANLRTCRNLEQFAITQDRGLFDFHRQWMESVHEREARRTSRD